MKNGLATAGERERYASKSSPDGFDTPEEAQRHDANRVNELLATAEIPVFYVMGNDDLVELNSNSDQVQSIHDRQVRRGARLIGQRVSYESDHTVLAASIMNLEPTKAL